MTTTLYVGCYTTVAPEGIHVFRVDDGGALQAIRSVEAEQASFLAIRPDTDTLYAVRETLDTGAVVAMRIADDGLTAIDEVASHGAAPCHVSTHGDRVHVANYASGTVASYALLPDGRFGEPAGVVRHDGSGPHARQESAHAHAIVPAPTGPWVHAADLGTDRIVRYDTTGGRLDPVGETVLSPGSGPRHLTFHPSLPLAFVVCELDCALAVAHVDEATGGLSPTVTVPMLPAGVDGGSIAAAVVVHPDGTRAYTSTRGHDSITTFAIDPGRGGVEPIANVASGGRTPRHIALDPSGSRLLVANQDSDTIVSFDLDDDGLPVEADVVAEVSQPACLVFARSDP